MKYFFLDTNVIIDVLASRQPFSESSARLFDLAEKGSKLTALTPDEVLSAI